MSFSNGLGELGLGELGLGEMGLGEMGGHHSYKDVIRRCKRFRPLGLHHSFQSVPQERLHTVVFCPLAASFHFH